VHIEQTFRNISRLMFANRWEYSYLDSRALIDARVEKDRLVHGHLQWKVIILPAVSTLPEAAWKKLEAFIKAGGKVIALELMPENSEDRFPDAEIQAAFETLFKEQDHAVYVEDWPSAGVEKILKSWLEQTVQLEDESLPIRLAHRKIGGRDVIFVLNDSPAEVSTTMALQVKGRLEEWDPATAIVRAVGNPTVLSLSPYHGKIYRTR
jgi:hypothetical protein